MILHTRYAYRYAFGDGSCVLRAFSRSMDVTVRDFDRASACYALNARTNDRGRLGWSARCESRSMAYAANRRGAHAAVHVRYDTVADIASTPSHFFVTGAGGITPASAEERRIAAASNEYGACVYASRDETVMGRCVDVTCAHRSITSRKNPLFARPTWNITIVDSRLNAIDLCKIVDAIDRVHVHLHVLGVNGMDMPIMSEITAWDLADSFVRHAVNSAMATWHRGSAGAHPNLARLFQGRAPGPTRLVSPPVPITSDDQAPPNPITFAGGNAAVAVVDGASVRAVLEAHAEDMDLDGIDDEIGGAAPGALATACVRAGIGENSGVRAKVFILMAQSDRTSGRSEHVAVVRHVDGYRVTGDAADTQPVVCCLFVGTPTAFVAALAHHVYDLLMFALMDRDPDWETFEGIERLAESAPSENAIEDNEALRAERRRAASIIAKAVDARADALCAHLWRTDGRLVGRMLAKYESPVASSVAVAKNLE